MYANAKYSRRMFFLEVNAPKYFYSHACEKRNLKSLSCIQLRNRKSSKKIPITPRLSKKILEHNHFYISF